ncbi:MAG: glycosyltransferase [Bacteroidales bacterium]|nr:glycosyltransferase [Bacteroidales bacterium]
MKVTAVIVTYNRLELLRKCISTVAAQTRKVDEIVVVDNHSTDGTAAFLADISRSHPDIHLLSLPENLGGAGGFEAGIRRAIELSADYVWIMDDDTHPSPSALEQLMSVAAEHPDMGFAASRVVWTDGSIHKMNSPLFCDKTLGSNMERLRAGAVECRAATFVSLLVPARVVRALGLPIGAFFIWHDDIEYTSRIFRAGHPGYYVPESIVVHATAENLGATIDNAPAKSAHRFYYQMRNYVATKRLEKGLLRGLVSGWLKYRRLRRDIKKRPDHRGIFMNEVKNGFRDGLSFRPTIPMINK